jgi:gamma-D-glutamyl-L-lysine dipeptidyl-peptidase
MRYGISNLSIIPVRTEPAEKSEMCTQVLFGEAYSILEETEKWTRIRIELDGYEGWIDRKMVNEVDGALITQLQQLPAVVTTDVFNIVQSPDSYNNFLIVAGSSLPFYNQKDKTFRIDGALYTIKGNVTIESPPDVRSTIIENALKYFNAPYLWGGRSPLGIDCSGLTQVLYKMVGIPIPRDASQQVQIGQHLSFVDEAQPGDLAFFDNEEGVITHVGIIWERNKIIHSSGKVRIDNVDQFGIYNAETRKYTHKMRLMKRIIDG